MNNAPYNAPYYGSPMLGVDSYNCGYGYPVYGDMCGYDGYRGGFALIVVLFILLIIIGATFSKKC